MSRTRRKTPPAKGTGAGVGHRPGSFMADKRSKRTKTRTEQKRRAIQDG